MINITSEVNLHLGRELTLYATIYMNTWLGESSEEIFSRVEPSEAGAGGRYMDGSRIDEMVIAYYAKSANQKTASDQLDAILEALDLCTDIKITEGLYIRSLGQSVPFFVSTDESGNYIFTCSIRIQYHIT